MSNLQQPVPYLLIASSDNTDKRIFRIPMTGDELAIGRPSPSDENTDFVDIEKLYPDRHESRMISRHHARILREGNSFVLENWKGQLPIGIYADQLTTGQKCTLKYNAAFRIPDLLERHFSFVLLSGERDTQVSGLLVEAAINRVYVFGNVVHCSPKEYQLLRYLYAHALTVCRYDDIIAAVYGSDTMNYKRKRSLEVLIGTLRKKLHSHSGGFSFLHTEDSIGLCLIT